MDCTCGLPPEGGGEHMVSCALWEPPLTVQEIRHIRRYVIPFLGGFVDEPSHVDG